MTVAAIIISAAALAWSIVWPLYRHRRASKPSISTNAAYALPVYDLPDGRRHLGPSAVSLTATNNGPQAVTISSVKFIIRGGPKGTSVFPLDWMVQTPCPLPVSLQPGEHWIGLAHAGSVKAAIDWNLGPRQRWYVCPVVSDSADRKYRAVVNVTGWRRLMPGARRWVELEHEKLSA